MNAEDKIKELNDELRSIKTAYAQVPFSFVLYTYDLGDLSDGYFISKTVTLATEDGSNTIATIENATYDRMPYQGGVRFFLSHIIKQGGTIKLHSMQKGTITIS